MRVDGLFGWVEHNNTRSIVLLLGFVLLMQPLGAIALTAPVLYADPAHAPWFHWGGYAARYVPVVTLGAIALFASQMWWHLKTVRKDVAFRFVDDEDEPRLCGLVEPLAIAAGIPTPYVGVLDSPAMNAFACGITRKHSVVVFTRGIIDGLDDDELSAVIAHELMHIRNGDSRLIAAANAFLRNLALLDRFSGWKPKRYRQLVSLLVLPVLFPVYLGMALLAQLCLRLGFASRLLISSAREFIADAEAIRLTQHPAALVSALQRIHGHSALPGLPFEQDAMMIDGMAATHPPIMERIQAIVAITGQMALDARPRRDTRGPASLRPGGFEPESLVADNLPALEQTAAVGEAPRGGGLRGFFARDDDRLVLGLRRNIALAMLAAFLGGMAIHRGNIAGVLGQVGNGYTLLANLASLKEQMRACQGFNVEALRGRVPASDSCDGVVAGFASQREPVGTNEHAAATQTRPAGVVATPASADKPKAKPKPEAKPEPKPGRQAAPQPTDLEPSYAMPVHEAWQRLAGGSIAPFLRARQCGITLDSRVSAVTDQSVTWTVTSEDVAQLRFTATLSADSPGTTRLSLDIADLEETVTISDKSKPKLPPYPVAMRPALKPPLRPYFAEAVNAMLEGRAFQASRVVPPPTLDAGANDTANLCASQRSRLATGARFSIHDRPGQP